MVSNITREDVIKVAKELMIPLTEEQINKVLHMYSHEEECDSSVDWVLIVENCIYQL